MVKQIFVNLIVKDLEATKAFWTTLGFTFNPQFTNQNAASLVLGENIFAMLLLPEFFSTFTKKELIDSKTSVEAINAVSLETKEEVDSMMEKILAAGGKEPRPASDYGWMYSRAFQDLDGHEWELLYADITKAPASPEAPAQQ